MAGELQRQPAECSPTGVVGSAPDELKGVRPLESGTQREPAPKTRRLRKAFHWATRGGLAILDQAFLAGGNFIANILLARWLPPTEYGAFALAYSTAFLFASFYHAVLIEPMTVFGSGRYAARFQGYLGVLLRVHLTLMIPLSLFLAGAAFVLGRVYSAGVQAAFLALAVTVPFKLLRTLGRVPFYVRARPGSAAGGAAIYFVVLMLCLYFLQASGRLSAPSTLLAMGVAHLLSSIFMLLRVRPRWISAEGDPTIGTVVRNHWRYGRWSLASAGVKWLPQNIYYAVLPFWLGLNEVGALKALANLSAPVTNSVSVLTMLLLPRLVRDRHEGGPPKMIRSIKVAFALFVSGSIVYLLFLLGFQSTIFELLYAGRYQEYGGWPLVLIGLLPLISCVVVISATSLRAFERPDQVYRGDVAAALVALSIGLPLAWATGIVGALAGKLAALLGAFVFMTYFSQKHLRQGAVPR